MLRNARLTTLATAALIVAGCARSDYVIPHAQKPKWRPAREAKPLKVKEAEPPKILPETHLAAGDLFERQGAFDKAEMQYRKAIAVQHKYAEAFNRLGVVLGKVGRHAEAIQSLNQAIALKPDNATYHNNLGFQFLLQQRWADAESELRRTLELAPGFERAQVNLAIVLGRQGQFDESIANFMAVLSERDAYYNAGLIYRSHQRLDDAERSFAKALSFDPQFAEAQFQLDEVRAMGGGVPSSFADAGSSSPGWSDSSLDVGRMNDVAFESSSGTQTADSSIQSWTVSGATGSTEVAATPSNWTVDDFTQGPSFDSSSGSSSVSSSLSIDALLRQIDGASESSPSGTVTLMTPEEQFNSSPADTMSSPWFLSTFEEFSTNGEPCEVEAIEVEPAAPFDQPSSDAWSPSEDREWAAEDEEPYTVELRPHATDEIARRFAVARNEILCWENKLETQDADVNAENAASEIQDESAGSLISEFELPSASVAIVADTMDVLEVPAVDVTAGRPADRPTGSTALTSIVKPN